MLKAFRREKKMEYSIRTEGLTKKYGKLTAVDGLTLEVREGELFALLGVNGAGKTTTVKMLSCVARPTGGDALLDGKSIVSEKAKVKELIGVSPAGIGGRSEPDGQGKP